METTPTTQQNSRNSYGHTPSQLKTFIVLCQTEIGRLFFLIFVTSSSLPRHLSLSDIQVQGERMSGGGTQNSLRRALGALKDTTTVSLAKVNSDYKELDIAIVKATNHYERPAKERHIRAIFAAVSATRPRADVAYCIHALARRLSRTHNWAVALKTLIVIHRALREVDQTFHEEIINYGRSRSHMLNMAHFKDDSSPNAWDYSAWVRTYALFLEERLECFRVLKYDVEMDRPRTKDLDTVEILEQLPALQQLLFRILGCQPQGAAANNFVIQLALQLVASESIRVYQAINDATANLVDKFFEMQRPDAAKALEIYRRACQQAERLSEFYEICKSMYIGRGEKFIKIEQPPLSFLQTMEEYVRDAPRVTTALKDQFVDNKIAAPKEILAIEYKKEPEVKEERPPSPPPPEPVKVEEPVAQPPDLLGLDDPVPVASELDEKNALALAIVPVAEQQSSPVPTHANGTTGWELALVTAPSSNESTAAASKLAGGLDKLTLDSLYDDAIRRSNQPVSYNPWEPVPVANPMMQTAVHDPFFASNTVAAPHSVQMSQMASQQQAFMLQQQQQQQQMMMMMMMGQQQQQPSNHFGNTYGSSVHPYGSEHSFYGIAQKNKTREISTFSFFRFGMLEDSIVVYHILLQPFQPASLPLMLKRVKSYGKIE
ncbi:clathrin assembly protein [Populus alba x Populus x berolinensis]|uniref:Clathrin assembly protein n=1 Tax=Populus alba x Populus x berolinensis TaxID=444605 RepID=A0AAD6LCZ4_9ROSI|nr:clathrin assembly protein [Populus alba x Populus x berolinensis]